VFEKLRVKIGVAGLVVVLGAFGAGSASDALPPTIPPGTTITCSQISGVITLRPGVGATGSSSGVKWMLKAVANNCSSSPTTAGTVFTNIIAATVKGSGFIVGGNTCAAAQAASNWGAAAMTINWFSTPAVASTTYSTVPAGGFNPSTTLDATGITHDRNNAGPTPVQLQLGGDWIATSAAQYATNCSGPAPAISTYIFQTPATSSTHNPAFVAQI